jgi:hypothetical protein
VQPFELAVDSVVVTELLVRSKQPELGDGGIDQCVYPVEGDDAFDAWQEAVLRVLRLWV